MDRQEFLRRADECLQRVVKWLEPFDPDEVDYAESDGVVTLEFADRVRFVLNRQTATNQMWFAAGARAWHYDWDDTKEAWVDEKDGHELYANIARVVSSKIGRKVDLAAST